jgi:TatD DNase family protein
MDQPEDVQKDVFVRQIVLADKLGLPLVVHTRDAFADTFEILMENRGKLRNGLLIHCFSEGTEEVEKLRELDAYFAFGGAITYKNNLKSADAIKAAPRDRLLLETDCPYLAPVPLRGIVNEPKNVRIVAEYMARILNLTTEEVGDMTLENTKRFYRIK